MDAAGSGNGNGRIESSGSPPERLLVWDHLSKAGLLNYGFSARGAVSASSATSPANAYGGFLDLAYDNFYTDLAVLARAGTTSRPAVNCRWRMLAEVDRKIDDGNAATGIYRGSATFGAGGLDNCWNAAGRWLSRDRLLELRGADLF